MASTSEAVRAYVGDRWSWHFLQALRAREETQRFLTAEALRIAPAPRFSLRGLIRETELAQFLADNDLLNGSTVDTWRKRFNNWANGKVPDPESVRDALRALGSDWLLGLGVIGYRQHAIALLHTLEHAGHRSDAAHYAIAIFAPSEWGVSRRSDRAASARLRPAYVTVPAERKI